MGLFDFFQGRTKPEQPDAGGRQAPDYELCANIRVEVTTPEGHLLFVAKLKNLVGTTAELHQYSESEGKDTLLPIPVHIRGYNDRQRKAVYMEGIISPMPQHIWLAEDLTVVRIGNDRAFFRLETNIDTIVTKFSGRNAGEKPCKLLNISVGGARIGSSHEYWEGDKLLLTVKLLEDREPSILYCQVLRVIPKGDSYEYGCKFLELNEADEGKITQNIFAAQRKMRRPYQ